MLIRNLATFLFLIITPLGVLAAHLPSRSFTSAEGLAGDGVIRIVPDSRGFLWFCTAEGLSRFDGQDFKNYNTEQGLPSRNVTDFLESRSGVLFVATSNGLAIFDPNGKAYAWNLQSDGLEKTGTEPEMFHTIFPPELGPDRTYRVVLTLGEDREGRIFAGTLKGLHRVERSGDAWVMRKIESPVLKEVIAVTDFESDKFGRIWFAANDGIYRVDPETELVEMVDDKGGESLLSDRDGQMWVTCGGAMQEGLRVFSFDENSKPVLTRRFTASDGLKPLFMRNIVQASSGKIYVLNGYELMEFLPDALETEPKFRTVADGYVITFAEDRAGNLWLGTDDRGARKLFMTGLTIFDQADGIGPDNITSIFANSSGFFVTTGERKLGFFNNGRFEFVEPFGLSHRSWGSGLLDTRAADGEWWIPAADGLRRYPRLANFAALANTPPTKVYTTADGLQGDEIFTLYRDSRGDIWFCSIYTPDSLQRLEPATGKVHRYTLDDGIPRSNGPNAFAEDLEGNVWLGLYYGGVLRYRNGKFQAFSEEDGVPKSSVLNIFRDSRGSIWISTASRGVLRVDDPTADIPTFTDLTTADGVTSNQVTCTTEDRLGRIYLATGRGVDRLDLQTGNVKNLSPADGLPGNIVSLCRADGDGNLWFSASRNLIRLTPQENAPQQSMRVYISGLHAGRVKQQVSELGQTDVSDMHFASDQRDVQIDYFALGYGNSDRPRYQYRLNDQAWSALSDQRTVDLNLAPGDYRFAVRAVNSDGVSSENPATVEFSIAPPFWQTWIFRVAVIVGVVILLILLDRVRAKRRRERRAAADALARANSERLKELEQVRRRIATDLHDDIGSSLTQISILSEVLRQRVATDQVAVAEPLSMIADSSRELVDSMSDIVWAINPQKDYVRDLVQRMRRFAADIFTVREIEFTFDAPASEIEIGANIRREIFLIFKEAVHNVVKHAGCSMVEIELTTSGINLELTVRDNGHGFDAAETGDGHGLASIRERASGVGGTVEIVSNANGTCVRAIVPMMVTKSLESRL